MAKEKKSSTGPPVRTRRTAEGRESELIALAYDLVEKRLREGTATSQETTHFLKLGSTKEKKELKLLERQIELMEAKAETLKSAKRIEELYADAISAVRSYSSPALAGDDHV